MNDTTYCINFPGKAMLGKARLGVGKTSTDWAKAVTNFLSDETINQHFHGGARRSGAKRGIGNID